MYVLKYGDAMTHLFGSIDLLKGSFLGFACFSRKF